MNPLPTDPLQRALQWLPHGPSFRFVDQLLTLEPGVRGSAEYRVRGDESFLAGHFPGDPIFPGVLLIEAAAQLAGIVAQSDPLHPPIPALRLTAVRAAKVLGAARPGDLIRLEARLSARLGPVVQLETSASVLTTLILRADISLGGTTQ